MQKSPEPISIQGIHRLLQQQALQQSEVNRIELSVPVQISLRALFFGQHDLCEQEFLQFDGIRNGS